VRGQSLALTARLRRTPPVPILMGEVEEQRHPYTGLPMLLRRDVVRPEPMPEFQQFDAADTERAPAGYVVPPDAGDVLDRLRAHGVRMRAMGEAPGGLEAFVVDSTWTAERAFQGHKERRVVGRWQPATALPPAGSVFVPMDQPLARLVFTLLEPRSDDGFTAWNLLDPWLERRVYPILRLPAPDRR